MRRLLILVALGLLLFGGGVAIGRYAVPTTSVAVPARSTTTTAATTAPQGPAPGIYNIGLSKSQPAQVGLFLVVQDVPPGPSLPAGGVSIDVSNRGADGSTQSLDKLVGTAVAGNLTLTSQTNPGEGSYQGSSDGQVSGSYGVVHGVPSISFGGGMCGAWGGPVAIQACNFTLSRS